MCIITPFGGVQPTAPVAQQDQALPQLMILQPLPAGKVPTLMATMSLMRPAPAPVKIPLQQLVPLPAAGATPSTTDDESSEALKPPAGEPPAGAMTRAARRRLRQRANKKKGKAGLLVKQADGCETDEELVFHEVSVDLPCLPQRAVAPVQAAPAAAVQISIVELGVQSVRDVPLLPKLSFGDMKSVPLCAYQAVRPLQESPEVRMEDAVVIESTRKVELPLRVSDGEALGEPKASELPSDAEAFPVVNTFIHFRPEMESRLGSGRRSRSCSC